MQCLNSNPITFVLLREEFNLLIYWDTFHAFVHVASKGIEVVSGHVKETHVGNSVVWSSPNVRTSNFFTLRSLEHCNVVV